MTRSLDETHRDVVTALIALGGSSDAMTLKKRIMEGGYRQLDAELAIQRSTDGQRLPLVVVQRNLHIAIEDDLPQRCAEAASWRRSGLYEGYLLAAHGAACVAKGLCSEDDSIRYAEDMTIRAALDRVAGSAGSAD